MNGTVNKHEQRRATKKRRMWTQQSGPAPKPTNGAQANDMVASLVGTRLTPQTEHERDFGEHIVGSNENVEQISVPFNLTNMPAIATFAVTGTAFALVDSSPTLTLPSSGALKGDELGNVMLNAPKVAFRPTRAGEALGALTITVNWPIDGYAETRTIALRGRARELSQAPTDFGPASTPQPTAATAETTPAGTSSTQDRDRSRDPERDGYVTKKELQNKDEVDTAIADTASAASKLARSQRDGLKIIDDEAKSYGKEIPKTPRSRWWDLAEMALNLATGNLAGMFASKLLPRLLSTTVVEDIPWVGEVSSTITPKLSEGLTGSIKSAIVLAGQKAIKAALPSEGPAATQAGTQGGAEAGKHSSNARIDFFAEQTAVLNDQEDEYEALVDAHARQVKPLALNHPKQAVRALSIVTEQFSQLTRDAEQAQANATAPAWATLVARLGLGQEVASSAAAPSTAHQATQMDSLRTTHRGSPANAANGVLDVYVSSGKVVSAKLNGVAQEVADRLADMPLSNAPMPIRFIMGRPGEPQPTILTRDEIGRVRAAGDLNGNTYEPDEARTGGELIARILSTPLSSMGIEIKTDDSTGRGP